MTRRRTMCESFAFTADRFGRPMQAKITTEALAQFTSSKMLRLQPQHLRTRELGQRFGGDLGLHRTAEAIRGKSEALAHRPTPCHGPVSRLKMWALNGLWSAVSVRRSGLIDTKIECIGISPVRLNLLPRAAKRI